MADTASTTASGAPEEKRIRTEAPKIGTHSGAFHCDEALACYMLKMLPEFKDATVTRSRDPAVLDTMDVLVDVGGVYDPSRHRYDHHQREFQDALDAKHDIRLSSAGLIYKHFGHRIIRQLLPETDEATTELVYQKAYRNFVEAVDAVDNGIEAFPKELKPRYRNGTHLASRVGNLNPPWNEKNPDPDGQFAKAMRMAGDEFVDAVNYIGRVWLPARAIVDRAVQHRAELDASGAIIFLDSSCPWKEHLEEIEQDMQLGEAIKFAIYTDEGGKWRVQGVPASPGSFQCRVFLRDDWRGLRDDALSTASGIPGCIFIHASGFIGGATTREAVIALARASLAYQPTAVATTATSS